MIDFVEPKKTSIVTIKVVGVGGAGGNTVNSIIESGCQNIECIAVNTDAQILELSKAPKKIQIGIKSTKGLGTGANPDLGQRSAEEDIDKIMEAIGDADIVFLSGGMGGGTGSGAVPVIARALKENGILSIAVVTKPFLFEGKRRERTAEHAIAHLKKAVDTLIVIPNQNLINIVDCNVSMIDSFSMINDILSQSVVGIADIITKPGHINVDFADVRAIMKDMGLAVLGTGRAVGENRAREATLKAISSPLLENMHIDGARGVLLNITGGKNLSLHEISQAASIVYEKADIDANIILGSVVDETLTDEICVTIIATGFNIQEAPREAAGVLAMKDLHVAKEIAREIIQKVEVAQTAEVKEIVHAQIDPSTSSGCLDFKKEIAPAHKIEQKIEFVEQAVEVKPVEPAVEPKIQASVRVVQEESIVESEETAIYHASQNLISPSVHAEPVEASNARLAAEESSSFFDQSNAQEEASIDVNDFDVPAFLRHKAQHKDLADQ